MRNSWKSRNGEKRVKVQDKIAAYYSEARELVRQGDPKAARTYVLAILEYAVQTYKRASTVRIKVKTQVFLDKWLEVSRELYEKGVTDYVLRCFGLPIKEEKKPSKVPQKPNRTAEEPEPIVGKSPSFKAGDIDISGLIDQIARRQQEWSAEVFAKNKSAVVGISVADRGVGGTGFIISKNGYLLTNDHVVFDENAQCYFAKLKMSFVGDKKNYKLSVIASDKKSDVAFCRFVPAEVGEFDTIKLVPDYSTVVQGSDCMLIGNAFGKGLSPIVGTVRFTENESGNLVHTAQSNPGDSGGPVLNRQGECIGINKSKTVAVNNQPADGFANATPMNTIKKLLDKWCETNGITL